MFDRTTSNISGFLMVCKLYIRIKMRNTIVREQVQWVLSYMQEGSADTWKENIMEDLENRSLMFTIVGEFLTDLRQEFSRRNNEMIKIAALKKVEQESKIMEEFV